MLKLCTRGSRFSVRGVIVVALLAVVLASLCACGSPQRETSDAYEFPARAGTEAWLEFETHAEMLAACQIPEEILESMSTPGLVETCLNYPLLGDMLAYDTVQQGFEAVLLRFNGLQELMRREGAGAALLEEYERMDPGAPEPWTPEQRGNSWADFAFIEALLAQDQILCKLTQAERSDLLSVALEVLRTKQQHPDVYSLFGEGHTALILGRLLQAEGFGPFTRSMAASDTLQDFIESGVVRRSEDVEAILLHSEAFLSE